MKQGISIERTYDLHDRLIVRILKRRGRLTLEEVSDLLRLEGGGEWSGWYAVLLNCTEGTIGGNGLYDSEDPYAAKIKHAQKDFLTSQGIHAIID